MGASNIDGAKIEVTGGPAFGGAGLLLPRIRGARDTMRPSARKRRGMRQDWSPVLSAILTYPERSWPDFHGAFVNDDRSFANIIMGNYQRPQPGNKGHFHEEGGEFWLICLGTIRYNIEGLPEFEAQEGDVVYVPRQTWHLASNGGTEGLRSCRLAMNGFPYQAHMFEQN